MHACELDVSHLIPNSIEWFFKRYTQERTNLSHPHSPQFNLIQFCHFSKINIHTSPKLWDLSVRRKFFWRYHKICETKYNKNPNMDQWVFPCFNCFAPLTRSFNKKEFERETIKASPFPRSLTNQKHNSIFHGKNNKLPLLRSKTSKKKKMPK